MTTLPRASRAGAGERGITLVEITVVGVLAAIVMLALTGFYVNSQGNWIDASAQAVTQREASMILAALSDSVHIASSASVNSGTHTLILFNKFGTERSRFWLESSDHLIHVGGGSPSVDQGPLASSTVSLFELTANDSMVYVSPLELLTASNHSVSMSIAAAIINRVVP